MLDDRKVRVLHAIINSYILRAEPIGSRTISRQYDLGVSSATIRNEMSDLEELGYLNKPHTSAGRIPSDKAYRLYVDQLLREEKRMMDMKRKEKIKRVLIEESQEIDQLLQNSAKIISAITSYTSLAISPQLKESRLRHIQLIPIGQAEILLVLVSELGIVRNTIFRVEQNIPGEQLLTISNFLNHSLKGHTMDEINRSMDEEVFKEIYDLKKVLDRIIPIINKSLEDIDSVDVYADGVTKIFNFPEYADLNKARSFISFIEDKELLTDLLMDVPLEEDIEITIGSENTYDPIKDCSLITTTYKMGDMTIGKIGVIGPTRMEYFKVINALRLFSVNISEILDMILGNPRV